MRLAIHELLESAPVTDAAIEKFLGAHEFPLVERRSATFVFRGAADEVDLVHWVYGLESSQPFERVAGANFWYRVMDLPERSRVEYKLGVTRDGRAELRRDALNAKVARDPYGANSVVYGSGYEPPEWAVGNDESRKGEVREHRLKSRAFGEVRPIQVYTPARYRPSRRYPVLIVHDGPDYLRFAALREVLDNLIHRLEIPPMVVAFTASSDRLVEYADDERHTKFLVDELLPTLEEEYSLLSYPAAKGLMGASFGGVASLAAAWRSPGTFGRLLLQSGSFAFTDIGSHDRGPVFDPVVEFVNRFRQQPGEPSEAVYLSCGRYESLIYYNLSLIHISEPTRPY